MIVLDEGRLAEEVERRKRAGERVILTNGTFDLLHVGHLRCLAAARALGDALVVLVNGDASAARLKGPGRPIIPERERAELLDALRVVDLVHVFQDATVDRLLENVRPHVHAKGTDYARAAIPERETARRLGIEVAIVGDPKGHSTTDVLERAGRWWSERGGREP